LNTAYSMGQGSFNSIWMKTEPGKDFDPPAYGTGMMLLRRCANADPILARFFPEGDLYPHDRLRSADFKSALA
jgi:hypothetical protein